MNPFTFNTTKSIRFGAGALDAPGEISRRHLGARVLLVTDAGLVATGIVQRAIGILHGSEVNTELFYGVEADPSEDVVLKAVPRAQAVENASEVGVRPIRTRLCKASDAPSNSCGCRP